MKMTIEEWRERLGIPWRAGLPLLKAAHRGGIVDECRPENSLDALLAAAQAGYDMLETDLRATSDHHPVVFHDRDATRVCGDEREIASLTLAQFKRLRYVDAEGGPVSFEDWLEALPEGTGIQLELKVAEAAPAFYKRVAEALERHSWWQRTLLFGREAPEFLGERTINWLSPEEALARAQAGKVEPGRYWFMAKVADLNEGLVGAVTEAGVLAFPAINTFHYDIEHCFHSGLEDVWRALQWPVRGIHVDSIYGEPLF
jgi:hypothetical protein